MKGLWYISVNLQKPNMLSLGHAGQEDQKDTEFRKLPLQSLRCAFLCSAIQKDLHPGDLGQNWCWHGWTQGGVPWGRGQPTVQEDAASLCPGHELSALSHQPPTTPVPWIKEKWTLQYAHRDNGWLHLTKPSLLGDLQSEYKLGPPPGPAQEHLSSWSLLLAQVNQTSHLPGAAWVYTYCPFYLSIEPPVTQASQFE